jgi:hypothetical protein
VIFLFACFEVGLINRCDRLEIRETAHTTITMRKRMLLVSNW